MYVVHKLELKPGLNHYDLPLGTELLHVAMQCGAPMLWYKRPTIAPTRENRVLLLTGTGQEITEPPRNSEWKFVGTMLIEDQDFVFHVFELAQTQRGWAGAQVLGEGR